MANNTDTTVTYHGNIKQMFRQFDIDSMQQFGIDLSTYEGVKENAPSIYKAVQGGTMPCDAPWSPEWVNTFQEWMNGGLLP